MHELECLFRLVRCFLYYKCPDIYLNNTVYVVLVTNKVDIVRLQEKVMSAQDKIADQIASRKNSIRSAKWQRPKNQ